MSKNALIGDTGTSMAFNTTGEGYSNKATQGGGIYSNGSGVYIGYKDESNAEAMTSDSYGVRHNSTTGTSGEGGGVVYMANSANTTHNISGGTFTSNSVSGSAKGGAIYFRAGKLNISGGAKITTSSTARTNDVYLFSKSCKLQPGQTFNGNGTNTPVAIYLGWTPTAGDAILTGSYVGSHYARFKIIYPVGWKIANTGKAHAN